MSKSNYPEKLDTSVEIPQVRDNVTEIGSDVFNSLRSALFQIEKTLGINPQGSAGSTVSSRISKSLDEAGNIKKEALDRANVLSGPITNADVSKVAAITETKLKLDFPTHLLQEQISVIDSSLDNIIQSLEQLNSILSTHVYPGALNRHSAVSISVAADAGSPSPVSAQSMTSSTLQETLKAVYDGHINYTGESIDSENNSHVASQIFYDNTASSILTANDVQSAIDQLSSTDGSSMQNAILNLNSNGIIRTGLVYDEFQGLEKGTLLVPATDISYTSPSGTSTSIISFTSNPTPSFVPDKFDVLTIIGSANSSDNKDYLISSVQMSLGQIQSIEIFGGPKFADTSGITAMVTRNGYISYNENSLNAAVRPRYSKSNTPDIQLALPNAATIISSGCNPSNVLLGINDNLTIEIDGATHVIPVFNTYFEVQNIDIIVSFINEYAVSNKLNIFAFKLTFSE